MFQYCLGRILAEELGFALQADALPGFPNTGQKIEGLSIEEPEQLLSGQKIDWDEVRADRSHRRIILYGWFQRYEYYRPWRQRYENGWPSTLLFKRQILSLGSLRMRSIRLLPDALGAAIFILR